MQESVNALWRYTGEMFEADEIDTIMERAWGGPNLEQLRERWLADIDAILINATLDKPGATGWRRAARPGGTPSTSAT